MASKGRDAGGMWQNKTYSVGRKHYFTVLPTGKSDFKYKEARLAILLINFLKKLYSNLLFKNSVMPQQRCQIQWI